MIIPSFCLQHRIYKIHLLDPISLINEINKEIGVYPSFSVIYKFNCSIFRRHFSLSIYIFKLSKHGKTVNRKSKLSLWES